MFSPCLYSCWLLSLQETISSLMACTTPSSRSLLVTSSEIPVCLFLSLPLSLSWPQGSFMPFSIPVLTHCVSLMTFSKRLRTSWSSGSKFKTSPTIFSFTLRMQLEAGISMLSSQTEKLKYTSSSFRQEKKRRTLKEFSPELFLLIIWAGGRFLISSISFAISLGSSLCPPER